MATKEEIERQINEKLETDIEWSELNKDDLEEFNDLTEQEEFVKTVVASYAGESAGSLTKSAVSNWSPGKAIGIFSSESKDVMDLFF